MTAPEKAKDLIEKFWNPTLNNGLDNVQKMNIAKAASIICVDEQMEVFKTLLQYEDFKNNFFLVDGLNDYALLKEEINKIKE